MTGAVAAVAVAGSANASITLDSFGTDETVTGSGGTVVYSPGLMTSPNWAPFGLFGTGTAQEKSARGSLASGQTISSNPWLTVTQAGGTLSVSNAIGTGTPVPHGVSSGVRYSAGMDASFDLSGLGDCFYFDDVTQGTGAVWTIVVTSRDNAGTWFRADILSGQLNGSRYFVHFSMFQAYNSSGVLLPGVSLDGTNADNIASIFLGQRLTSSSTAIVTSTMTEFGMIPAPGAIALLGAAGLVGARRRR